MASPTLEDDLDKLTRSFEEQAAQDLQLASHSREAEQKKRKQPKGMKEIRQEGLEAPLSEQSKGFRMLSQMGYQKGAGLGKHGNGRAEPIDLLIKDKRTGLGLEEERKRKRETAEKSEATRVLKRQQLGSMMQKDFSQQQSERLASKKFEAQLRNARKVIETLDRRKGLEQSFLWPLPEVSETEQEQVEETDQNPEVDVADPEPTWEDQPVKDKLVTSLTYLRAHHFYCLHCGAQFEDSQDLESQCPGLMEEDH